MELSPEIQARLKELEDKDPVAICAESGDAVIVRSRVPRAEYKRFRAKSSDKDKAADALEGLLRACLLYPDGPGLDAMLDRKPALADVFGAKLLELAGLSGEAEVKK